MQMPVESGQPEGDRQPVSLALLARTRDEVLRRCTRSLVTSTIGFSLLLVVAIMAAPTHNASVAISTFWSFVGFVVGATWFGRLGSRARQNREHMLRPSRRVMLAAAYAPPRRPGWQLPTLLLLAGVALWYVSPYVAVFALAGYLALNVVGLVRLVLVPRRHGAAALDTTVLGYFVRHQDDPIFAVALTDDELAATPEVPDAPSLRRPLKSEWPDLPVQPPAESYNVRVRVALAVSLISTVVGVALVNRVDTQVQLASQAWTLLLLGLGGLAVALGLLVYSFVLLRKRGRARQREAECGYSTVKAEKLGEIFGRAGG